MSRSHPKHRIATRTSHCLGYQIHTICTLISAGGAGSSPSPPPPPTHTYTSTGNLRLCYGVQKSRHKRRNKSSPSVARLVGWYTTFTWNAGRPSTSNSWQSLGPAIPESQTNPLRGWRLSLTGTSRPPEKASRCLPKSDIAQLAFRTIITSDATRRAGQDAWRAINGDAGSRSWQALGAWRGQYGVRTTAPGQCILYMAYPVASRVGV